MLDRALRRSLRLVQINNYERFRCKEPLAEELISQLKSSVPHFSEITSLKNLIDFSTELKQWVDAKFSVLDESLGTSLLSPLPNIINKPQPPFVVSLISTLIRYELLAKYLPVLKILNVGCILGGSLSYGSFFNVRQDLSGSENYDKQSDIDLLLVADFNDLGNLANNFKNLNSSSSISNILYGVLPILNVISTESDGLDINKIVVSKKFKIDTEFKIGEIFSPYSCSNYSFPLSIHIVSPNVFEILTNPLSYENYRSEPEKNRTILYDFRLDSKLPAFMLYSIMEGVSVPESLSSIVKKDEIINFGDTQATLSICEIPAYFYWENRFVSGAYQNLIIPQFEILSENRDGSLEKGCDNLKKFLLNEGLNELSLYRDSKLSLSKLHPRYKIFPKYVSDKFDRLLEKHLTVDNGMINRSYCDQSKIEVRKKFHQKYRKDRSFYNTILELINHSDRLNSNVLEIGCGNGDFLNLLEKSGHRGLRVGVDLVKGWKKNMASRANFIHGNVESLCKLLKENNLENIKFDFIVAIHVLYHIKNIPSLLEQIISVMKKDGVFVATTNSNYNLHLINDVASQAMFKLRLRGLRNKQYNSFSSENALEILREYFSFVENTVTETEIEINEIEDIINYLESNFDNYEIPNDAVLRNRLKNEINEILFNCLKKGNLIDRKIVSLIVAKSPSYSVV